MRVLGLLVAAAVLEIGGDAAIRKGLVDATRHWLVAGATALVGYGLVVNLNRQIDFGRLIGVYIAVLFVVTQLVAFAVFGERPGPALLLGGALIVVGGLVIQLGAG